MTSCAIWHSCTAVILRLMGMFSRSLYYDIIVGPLLSGHPGDFENWPFNRGTIKLG